MVWSQNCDLTQKIENGACVDCADGEVQGKVQASQLLVLTFNINVVK